MPPGLVPAVRLLGLLIFAIWLTCVPIIAFEADRGDFILVVEPENDGDDAEALVRERGVFEDLLASLNETVALPTDVTVVFQSGDGPYYDPESREIVMNYEFIYWLAEIFEDEFDSQEELEGAILDATAFVLFHEVGHVLVDVLDLPVTGREEDAVDGLATLVSTMLDDGDSRVALTGGISFGLGMEDVEESDFWDEHSLDAQRFYSILCWVYGSDPDTYETLLEDLEVPEERASRCVEEFEQIDHSWTTLLSPHLKD